MSDPTRPATALQDYRATFGSSFDLRRLWADRRAILADPRIATEPSPPLWFPPLRFAMTLMIVPMLALGWLSSQLAGVMYPEGRPPAPLELAARAVEAPLDAYLGAPTDAELRALRVPTSSLSPEAQDVARRARDRVEIQPFDATPDALGLREASTAMVEELKASALPDSTRRAIAANLLLKTRGRRHIDAVSLGLLRSFMEGGVGMQVISALGLVVTAWRFKRSMRGDERFPRGERAGALYLYYSAARLFWITMLSILAYGVLAFASASGDTALFQQVHRITQFIALASTIYLLCYSATLARALRDDDALPKGAAFAVGRRLLWSQIVAIVGLMLVGALVGVALGAASAFWYLR